jgi:hypothetical protein
MCESIDFCLTCKKYFQTKENHDKKCSYHEGRVKTKVTGYDTWGAHERDSWMCCDKIFNSSSEQFGCQMRKHISFRENVF